MQKLPLIGDAASAAQYAIFHAGGDYCLPVARVAAVVAWPPLTPVPLAPDFLLGIFDWNGTIVPVIDLSRGQGGADRRGSSVVIVRAAGVDRPLVGLAAAAVRSGSVVATRKEPGGPDFAPEIADLGGGQHANLLNIEALIEVFCIPSI